MLPWERDEQEERRKRLEKQAIEEGYGNAFSIGFGNYVRPDACSYCCGDGWVTWQNENCPVCNGSGSNNLEIIEKYKKGK